MPEFIDDRRSGDDHGVALRCSWLFVHCSSTYLSLSLFISFTIYSLANSIKVYILVQCLLYPSALLTYSFSIALSKDYLVVTLQVSKDRHKLKRQVVVKPRPMNKKQNGILFNKQSNWTINSNFHSKFEQVFILPCNSPGIKQIHTSPCGPYRSTSWRL